MRRIFIKSVWLVVWLLSLGSWSAYGQLTSHEAGYVDAVLDYGADNTGATVTTIELQNAIDGAIAQAKPLFLPAGTYLIDGTLDVEANNADSHAPTTWVIITGSRVDPDNRTVLRLKAGSFTDAANPEVMVNSIGWDETGVAEKFTDTYDRVLQSVDFEIESNNAGAVALNWRGAEGCGIFDVNIDVTGGSRGMIEAPGSGGSTVGVSIIGGEIGIDLRDDNFTNGGGTQPTPVFTDIHFEGQTQCAVFTEWNRGAIVFTGCEFNMNTGVPVVHGYRPTSFTYYYGGNVLLNDCKIDYASYDASNLVAEVQADKSSWDYSINLSNVYVRNADRIIDHDVTVESRKDGGWRCYTELAYSSGVASFSGGDPDEGIYLEGIRQPADIYEDSQDVTQLPSNLLTYHSFGNLPSHETSGAINVADYSSYVDNGDWAPAFNQAIADAASGSNVVFVPVGEYDTYTVIDMLDHTCLIGVSSVHSSIHGYDMDGRRFGGSTNPYTDPKPMIRTTENTNADPVLADLGIHPMGPYNNAAHTPEACATYSVLWRAGRNSIIRNILYEQKSTTHYRPSNVIRIQLKKDQWLGLKSAPSPNTVDGMVFTSHCESRYFDRPELASRFWVEDIDHDGTATDRRLMARSHSPINAASPLIDKPNIVITKNGGGTFELTSIEVANASFDPYGGHDILIEAYDGSDNLLQSHTVNMTGLYKDRETNELVNLSWTGVTKIIITSESMFSIDDVVIDAGTAIAFESALTDERTIADDGVDWNAALYYDTARDLPISMIGNHLVKITGGVKWYNHWKHGDTWMPPTKAYVYVENTNEPVNFYHFHAQHSSNDQKLLIKNSSNVSVFGIKTENTGYFMKAYDSDNIRVFGHGGLTSSPAPSTHYYFNNTSNYLLSSPTDEIYSSDNCQYCGGGNAMLPRAAFGSFYPVVHIDAGGNETYSANTDRPILWQYGNPTAAYLEFCSQTQTLTVNSGSGGGEICEGTSATITANAIDCKTFDAWTGSAADVALLNDATAATAEISAMPARSVELTATYTDNTTYTVTVTSGSASPTTTCAGQTVDLTADTPLSGQRFDQWTGDVANVSDIKNPNATLTMPAGDVNLTATYTATFPDIKINFQPTGYTTPSGYYADNGLIYDYRSDGFTYGWDALNSSTKDRAQGGYTDLQNTLIHMDQGTPMVWEIEVPDGDYLVKIGAGDTQWADAVNNLIIEGTIENDPDGADDWDLIETSVSVSDGKLTIEQGTDGYAKLCYIEISAVLSGPKYDLTVENGSGTGNYLESATVAVSADSPPGGQAFDQWIGSGSVYLADINAASTNLTMPAQAVTVTATYTTAYQLTVNSGSGSGEYAAGTEVSISADVVSGKVFGTWTGTGAAYVTDISSGNTTVTMPAQAIELTATYYDGVVDAVHQWLVNNNEADEIGSKTLILSGSPSYTTTQVVEGTHALELAGAGSGQVASGGLIDLLPGANTGFSINLWAYSDGSQVHQNYLLGNISGGIGFDLYVNDYNSTNGKVVLESNSGSGAVFVKGAEGDFPFNQWNMVSLVVDDANNFKVYINAEQVLSGTMETGTPFDQELVFGGSRVGGWNPWKGKLDDIRTYEVPLEAADITNLYRSYAKEVVVNNGDGDGYYAPYSTVYVTAMTAPGGQIFDAWTGPDVGLLADETAANTSFTMPDATVEITASFATAPTGLPTHQWLVNNNTDDEYTTNPLTLINSPVYSSSNPLEGTHALEFAGSASNQHASAGTVDLGDEFTISLWAYNDGTQTHQNWLLSNRDASQYGFQFYVNKYNTTDGALAFETKSAAGTDWTTSAAGVFPFNQWNLVAVTVESNGDYTIYVNGNNAVCTGTVKSGTPFNNPLYIGSQGNGGTWNTYKGMMDDIRTYAEALSGEQLQTLYDQYVGGITWDGSESNDWFTAANWTPEDRVPASTDNVNIPASGSYANAPVIAGSTTAECKDLTVSSTAILTIDPEASLTVSGDLTVDAGGQLILESPENSGRCGSLITEGAVTGEIHAKRFIQAWNWHYISSPVANVSTSIFTSHTPNVYAYNESQDWTTGWQKISIDETMPAGKAYSLYSEYKMLDFVGTPHNGDQAIDVSYHALENNTHDGWNLVGNPFPSALDWEQLVSTNTENTIYYYNADLGNGTSSVDNYAYYNFGGFDTGAPYGLSVNGGLQYILPHQGFFVRALSSAGESGSPLVFSQAARVHSTAGTFLKKQKTEPQNLLRLISSHNGMADETVLRFLNDATDLYDQQYDAVKMFSNSNELPQIYSLIGSTQELAINSLNTNDLENQACIPLGFKAAQAGTYTISASGLGSFANDQHILLKDKYQERLINLREQNSYHFEASVANIRDRFEVIIKKGQLTASDPITGEPQIDITAQAGNLRINILTGQAANGQAEVYNCMGQKVMQVTVYQGVNVVPCQQAAGVYLVKVVTDTQSKSKRVFIEK